MQAKYEPIWLDLTVKTVFVLKKKSAEIKSILSCKELTYLLFKNLRSEFSAHFEVPLVCGKLSPKVFTK